MTSRRNTLARLALALWAVSSAQAQAVAEPAPALQGMDVVSG
jgi:hypothetical protein